MYAGVQTAGGIAAALTCSFVYQGAALGLGPAGKSTWMGASVAEIVFTFVLAYVVLCVAVSQTTKLYRLVLQLRPLHSQCSSRRWRTRPLRSSEVLPQQAFSRSLMRWTWPCLRKRPQCRERAQRRELVQEVINSYQIYSKLQSTRKPLELNFSNGKITTFSFCTERCRALLRQLQFPVDMSASCFRRDSKLITAISVAFFALLGCAIRVSFELWLHHLDFGVTTSHPGPFILKDSHKCYKRSSAAGYFFQNVLGCILMAAVARHKKAMNQHLATGLSSGLCGALTTWATWMGEVAHTITNGYAFQAFVSVLCMLCVSLASYRFGHFLAGCGMEDEPKCFDEYCGLRILFSRQEKNIEMVEDGETASDSDGENGTEHEWGLHVDEPSSWREQSEKEVFLSDAVHAAITGLALIYIVTFLGIAGGHKYYTGLLDMSMAPFGALLRWWLSLFNKYTAPFPFFTLLANTLGCLCNALAGVYEAT
eukprot:s1471_g3.t1